MSDVAGEGVDELLLQLDNLRIVSTLVACGNVTSAAAALGKSPSVVVRGIAELERTLDIKVVDRRRGGVSLTSHGRLLYARIQRVEAEGAAAVAELARLQGTSIAALRHLLHSGRKLLLLVHLTDAGVISGAAVTLGITQPGASLALSRIEESIGVVLFYRSLKGVYPTDAAVRLILRAQRIRAELRHALSDLAAVTGSSSGTTVVGTLPMARADLLPRAIGACLDVWPQLRVQIVEAQREALLAKLRAGEIDALLSARNSSFDPRGLVVEPLLGDRQIIVAHRDHPLAAMGRVDLAAVAPAKWILPWENAVSRTLFDHQFEERGIQPPRPVVETGDLLVMRPLLARGDMLAFTSWSLVRFEIEAGMLVEIDVEMDELVRDVVLLRRDGAQLPVSATMLIEELKKAAADGA